MIQKLQIVCGIVLAILLLGCGEEERELPDQIELRMTGSRYKWEIRHAAWDSNFGTDGDVVSGGDRLLLPLGVPVRIDLRSDDFIYGVSSVDLDVAGIAVPGLENSIELVLNNPGGYPLRGNQMCGYSHPDLMVTLEVVTAEEYARWLAGARVDS